jgi:uncharacterized protein YqjF (DUF2071 family)
MVQRWHDLLFAHWRCSIDDLRSSVPAPFEIDTCDGSAWIGVVPFYMRGVRMRALPPVPSAHSFAELNVRTYVTLDGRPGVWFFSLDAESMLAVIGARIGVALPYFRAAMRVTRNGDVIGYDSRRWPIAGPAASLRASYRGVGAPFAARPGTIEHFLTERYCFYSSHGQRIWRGDIFHEPWSLQAGEADITTNSMLAAARVRPLSPEPLLHFSAFQDVRLWWPRRVR